MKENNVITKDVLEVLKEKEYDLINIKEDCLFMDYVDIEEKSENKNTSIPTRLFVREGSDIFKSLLKKQKIYSFNYKNIEYIITISDKQINISERKINNNEIHETTINLYDNKDYSISKYIHDLNHSTKLHKTYSTKRKCPIEIFNIDKKEAIELVQSLLDNLKNVYFIHNIINIYYVYYRLNLVPDTWYNPIISDEEITLSSNRYSSIDTVNNKSNCAFNIMLNDTKEKVGEITFNLKKDSFTYDGNVGYKIYEEFRNKGYATRALNLLKEIVKTNKFVGDKDLFIATTPENIYSQKVVQNNDGSLIYDGQVPENDQFNYKHGVKEVKVYQIRMNREQINN